MKQIISLLLTILLTALLPLYAAFNTSLSSVKDTCIHETHIPYFHHHKCSHFQHAAEGAKIPFGPKMGKYIKERLKLDGPYRINTIVIDAGHGGKDSGTLGKYYQEKKLALNIALKLGEAIQSVYPGIRVIYTRKTDVFIPLNKRAEIANKEKADLFLSIHCNFATYSSRVRGTETYVMGLHTAEYNLEVAKRENASILLEENYKETYGGYDPNSPEGHILLSMFQNAYLEQSILFAEKVENQFGTSGRRKSRGVKQAGFVVLKETAMPSVLIETGFMSNRQEELFLGSEEGQNQIANSVLAAFTAYKREMESDNADFKALPAAQTKQLETRRPSPSNSENVSRSVPIRKEPEPAVNEDPTPVPTLEFSRITEKEKQDPPTRTPEVDEVVEISKPEPETKVRPNQGNIFIQFKVQILSEKTPVPTDGTRWRNLNCLVEMKQENGFFKYLATGFSSFDEAAEAKRSLRENGFPEAFVVAYANGKRISVREALKYEDIRP